MVDAAFEASTVRLFHDRADAGRLLALRLTSLRGSSPIVLGLPRGGVPVAAQVAEALDAPLDVVLVRKLGVPYQPELAFGAIGEGGIRVLNNDVLSHVGLSDADVAAVERRERLELERRALRYRAGRPSVPLLDRTVVIVDDGIATGSTAAAACRVVRAGGAKRLVLATPVAPSGSVTALEEIADEVVTVLQPETFFAIGQWYEDFTQITDEEVVGLLRRFHAEE